MSICSFSTWLPGGGGGWAAVTPVIGFTCAATSIQLVPLILFSSAKTTAKQGMGCQSGFPDKALGRVDREQRKGLSS